MVPELLPLGAADRPQLGIKLPNQSLQHGHKDGTVREATAGQLRKLLQPLLCHCGLQASVSSAFLSVAALSASPWSFASVRVSPSITWLLSLGSGREGSV